MLNDEEFNNAVRLWMLVQDRLGKTLAASAAVDDMVILTQSADFTWPQLERVLRKLMVTSHWPLRFADVLERVTGRDMSGEGDAAARFSRLRDFTRGLAQVAVYGDCQTAWAVRDALGGIEGMMEMRSSDIERARAAFIRSWVTAPEGNGAPLAEQYGRSQTPHVFFVGTEEDCRAVCGSDWFRQLWPGAVMPGAKALPMQGGAALPPPCGERPATREERDRIISEILGDDLAPKRRIDALFPNQGA